MVIVVSGNIKITSPVFEALQTIVNIFLDLGHYCLVDH